MCKIKDALILVIDDNPDNLFLMEMLFTQDGYRVETASCGQDGLAKIHLLLPDLIILDMMMPDMTGFEVIEAIKLHERLSSIPVIVCTANKFVRQKNVENVRAVCYKPINIDSILAKVDSLIACCDRPNPRNKTVAIDTEQKPFCLKDCQPNLNFNNSSWNSQALANKGYKTLAI